MHGNILDALNKAKQRQKEHGGTAPGKTKDTSGKSATSDVGKSRDKVAKQLGVSGRQLDDLSKQYETGRGQDLSNAERDEKGHVKSLKKDKLSSTRDEDVNEKTAKKVVT